MTRNKKAIKIKEKTKHKSFFKKNSYHMILVEMSIINTLLARFYRKKHNNEMRSIL